MAASNEKFDAELYFTLYDEKAFISVSLVSAGSLPDSSDLSVSIGGGSTLGKSNTDIPADFPLPIGAEPISLPDKLAGEGYQLAFSYPDMPELAYIQFSAAIVSSGWMIGNPEMGGNSYTMPFSNPATGFEGYALLTSNPETAGVGSISGCIVALHPGN